VVEFEVRNISVRRAISRLENIVVYLGRHEGEIRCFR
jgi:hypothetical protein